MIYFFCLQGKGATRELRSVCFVYKKYTAYRGAAGKVAQDRRKGGRVASGKREGENSDTGKGGVGKGDLIALKTGQHGK